MAFKYDGQSANADAPALAQQKKNKVAHIEQERAAYIEGDKAQHIESISHIWSSVSQNPQHFRSPGHHTPSAPLHDHTPLDDNHSELLIRDTPGRHIYYFDSLALDFSKSHVQLRLERKQKAKGISLKESFDEVTVKIGNKAESRIEDSVRVDLALWQDEGFYKALKAGMKAEVEALAMAGEAGAAKKRHKEVKALKRALIDAVGHEALKEQEVFPLVHLTRNTIETCFSPPDDSSSIVEIKTDLCDSVNVLGHIRSFAQFEAEGVAGDFNHIDRTMQAFCDDPELVLTPTSDSKADPSFSDLRPWIVEQNSSSHERLRVQANRKRLKDKLCTLRFRALESRDLRLIPPPSND